MAQAFATLPGLSALDDAGRTRVENAIAASWRPWASTAISGLLITGIYNLLHRPVETKEFHILFGIKMLAALHIFAVTLLATKSDNPRRKRQLTGVAISGVIVFILSAAFRWV